MKDKSTKFHASQQNMILKILALVEKQILNSKRNDDDTTALGWYHILIRLKGLWKVHNRITKQNSKS